MSHVRRVLGPMRVPFLALTIVCVLLGIATAFHAQGRVAWPVAALALVAALAAHDADAAASLAMAHAAKAKQALIARMLAALGLKT